MTELELVLATLTGEELDDADRLVRWLADWWRRLPEGDRPVMGVGASDGPWHLFVGMRLAILREQTLRGGAEPWYAGMDLQGHPAASVVRGYQRRLELNPDFALSDRLTAAGVLTRACPLCGVERPLTVAFWGYEDGRWSALCNRCWVAPADWRERLEEVPA